MSISDFIDRLSSKEKYTFYLNDCIIDLSELYDNFETLIRFEFENPNVIRLYAKCDYS